MSRRLDGGAVRARLRAPAPERRRFGYRRLHILLAREGVRLNHKRLFRICREERLDVRKLAETRCVCGWGGRHALAHGVAKGREPALVLGLRVGRAATPSG